MDTWQGIDSEVSQTVREMSDANLEAAGVQDRLVSEWSNTETIIWGGGYEGRTIHELVQNGADEILRWVQDPERPDFESGRLRVVLTSTDLYCANEGSPISVDGVKTMLSAFNSGKRDDQIGRFGVGFKAVLQVTDQPEFYSTTGSFRFSKKVAKRLFSKIDSESECPVLRTATPIDFEEESAGEPILAELAEWGASSIVRLRLKPKMAGVLEDNIKTFDAEFLLFSPHVTSLHLESRIGTGMFRNLELELERSSNGTICREQEETSWSGTLLLTEGNESVKWFVAQRVHRLSQGALDEAGPITQRERVPVTWAVPESGTRLGRFWAFFSTDFETTLSGILNAPWKTNPDRTSLHSAGEGDRDKNGFTYNGELLNVATDLVVSSIPELRELWPDDHCRFLLALPGRFDGPEPKNWADRLLSEKVYRKGKTSPILPDQSGELKTPTALQLHPRLQGEAKEALVKWTSYEGRPTDWVHPDVDKGSAIDKRARAARLMKPDDSDSVVSDFNTWLRALVQDRTPAASLAALNVAADLLDHLPATQHEEVRNPAILLTDGDRLVPVRPGEVFIPGTYDPGDGAQYLHDELAQESNRPLFERLGIEEISPQIELAGLVQAGLSDATEWPMLWRLVRKSDETEAFRILQGTSDSPEPVRVKVKSGRWVRIFDALREGDIVTADGDPQATLDEESHEQDLDLLERLGLRDKPHPGGGSQSEGWFDDYRRDALSAWRQVVRARDGGNPQEHLVQFREQVEFGPLAPLVHLSDEARVRFTRHVLPFKEMLTRRWNIGHTSPRYPWTTHESPTLWMLKREGRIETRLGIRAPKDCVGPNVGRLADAFPVGDISNDQVALLGLPNDPDDFGEQIWTEAISRADQVSDELIGALYGLAASHGRTPPENIHCLVAAGQRDYVPPASVVVVTDESKLEAMFSDGRPCLLSSTQDAEVLVARWGLSMYDPSVRFEIEYQISRPEMLLVEEYPGLKQHLDDMDTFLISIQCSSLEKVAITDSGANSEPASMLIDDDRRVYWHEDLSREDFIRLLGDHLELGLDDGDIRNVLDEEARAPRRRLVREIRRKKRFESKLLHVVPAESIRRHMPAVVLQVAEEELGELDDIQVVELARACFGPRLLAQLRAEFEQAGLEPPNQFAGGRAARVWVEELGFPREYAGFESASREPLLEIEGPPDLPPLHDYQEQVKTSMQQLLRESAGNRGLLCLPTGAGKTRVAVQSLVELIREGELGGPILWVAQTDELCEQAVQTWSEIWRAEGSDDRLALSRLWSRNEVQERADQPQVVVATIAKLDVLDGAEPGSGTDGYGWLAEASCVIVDEAHRALGPSYNRLLRWLQLDRNRKTRNLIGLTATPFRGTDETATEALVRRFQRRRIDSGVFMDPYRELQELGFLAKTKHKKLKGRTIDLSPDELDHLNKFRALPRSAEKRVGDDRVRNRAIIRSIGGLDEDWPVLVFTASVAHAQALAAILSLKGITAAAITSQTSAGARRHQIEQFRSGTLRVLTNYAVLTEGFDAPKIRALYITRPTYSPNLYQQMIGRGLRGPRNGGDKECLIVDVEDNIAMYEGQLAFNEFESLWS